MLSLADASLIDRAHRALRRHPGDTEPPRPLVVRLHYSQHVTAILRTAATLKDIFYEGLEDPQLHS